MRLTQKVLFALSTNSDRKLTYAELVKLTGLKNNQLMKTLWYLNSVSCIVAIERGAFKRRKIGATKMNYYSLFFLRIK